MAPGISQKAHFKHFRALAAKWPQEATRSIILNIFGPWPPNGSHRYVFTLFALRSKSIDLPQDADLVAFSQAILPVTIEQASFTAIYGPANAALPAA